MMLFSPFVGVAFTVVVILIRVNWFLVSAETGGK